LPLILVRGIDNRAPSMHAADAVGGKQGLTSVLTPAQRLCRNECR
jgi:hypothetical protein